MSHTKYQSYTRRAILSRVGGSAALAALTPFMPLTEAEAQESDKPRYLSMFTPVAPSRGFMDKCLPSGGDDIQNLEWQGEYKELNRMSDKMSLYRGMSNLAGNDSNLGGGHRGRCFTFLTGVPVKANQVGTGDRIEGNNGNNESPSIDQFLVDKMRNTLPINELRFGWAIQQVDSMDTASFRNGRKRFFNSAKNIFDSIFDNAGQGATGGGGGEDLTYRKNILDTVYKDLNRIKSKLSTLDAGRLEYHLEAVDELQAEISRVAPQPTGSCEVPAGLGDARGYEDESKAFAKLVAVAFNCNLTRVASAMYGHPYDDITVFDLEARAGRISNWHQATHGKGGSQAQIGDVISSVLKYRASVYLKVLDELSEFTTGGQTNLLDRTIVHWFTESPYDHSYNDCFNVIGGGADYFQMGKQHIVGGRTGRNNDAPLNMLLTSIAQAMGYNEGNFGNYRKGPIPGKYLA